MHSLTKGKVKGKVKSYAAGFISAVLLLTLGVAVYAAPRTQTITITYNDISLVVNGQPITPRDAAGNVVEPFIYNGTTFLPVRALAEALGQEARWDGATATVYVGTATPPAQPAPAPVPEPQPQPEPQPMPEPAPEPAPPAAPVEREIMLFDQQHSEVGNIAGFRADGNNMTNTIRLWSEDAINAEGRRVSGNHVVYQLPLGATRFRATLNPPRDVSTPVLIYRILGDGRLLYESPSMTANVTAADIDIDVTGVSFLRIEVILESQGSGWGHTVIHGGRTNAWRGIENARVVVAE